MSACRACNVSLERPAAAAFSAQHAVGAQVASSVCRLDGATCQSTRVDSSPGPHPLEFASRFDLPVRRRSGPRPTSRRTRRLDVSSSVTQLPSHSGLFVVPPPLFAEVSDTTSRELSTPPTGEGCTPPKTF